MTTSQAHILAEYGPYPDVENVAGVTFDGKNVWFASGDKLNAIDPETGAVIRVIRSNRMVTGVTWVDGELWHATWEDEESDLRRLDPETGAVLETIVMPQGTGVSGLESDGGERFFCGGGRSGKVRAVRRPARS